MITASTGVPGGTNHIWPKLRVSTKRSSAPSEFQRRTRVWRQGSWGCSSQRNWPVMRRCTPQWPASLAPSPPGRLRLAIRYLPRRCQPSRRLPSRAWQKAAGSGGAAIARARSTSTRAISKPRVWRSRPRRTVSTSGSSGKVGEPAGVQVAMAKPQSVWDRGWGWAGRKPALCQGNGPGRIRP